MGVVRLPDVGVIPSPAATFEVTKALFLPIASRIFIATQVRSIGQQTPGIVVIQRPDLMHVSRQLPAIAFKDRSVAGPALPWLNETQQRAVVLVGQLDMGLALHPKQIVPVQALHLTD